MEDLPNKCEIKIISPHNILFMKFDGDLDDEQYREVWKKGIELSRKYDAYKFLFEQQTLGKVSFKARGWVILKLIPRIKKILTRNIIVGIVTANDKVNESGIRYLVKMFESLTDFEITFYPDEEAAIEVLAKK